MNHEADRLPERNQRRAFGSRRDLRAVKSYERAFSSRTASARISACEINRFERLTTAQMDLMWARHMAAPRPVNADPTRPPGDAPDRAWMFYTPLDISAINAAGFHGLDPYCWWRSAFGGA
ncbi:hypothetical protein ACFPER_09405 [Agromyces aurantiacus]|uniref:Uncharacterized protein n=1 Tax=Agromyces aurantiacus TaxID=165814 RepID=A0ABV9R686_9MICO|nr:hypothetical protein [Agromyces aurantiacus]MBM7503689.1 hypothetical protein [Agromyces aurantiacus]